MTTDDGRPDWLDMVPDDFRDHGPPAVLFELGPGQVPADDGHGTGDLMTLLDD